MSFIYNFILCFVLISAFYEFNTNKYVSKTWFYSIIILMALTAGLAYAISPDWVPYWNAFEGSNYMGFGDLIWFSDKMAMEIGYIFLNKFIGSLGFGYASFLLILVSISLYLKSVTMYQYGGYVFLSLLLYITPTYFVEEHVHLRQGIATAVTMYSIRYVIDRRLYPFLICIVIAFLFHKSSIVFVFAFWIVKLKLKPVKIAFLIGLSIIISITGFSNLINSVIQLMPFGIGESFMGYANEEVEESVIGIIVKLLIVISVVIFDKSASNNDPYYEYFRNIYLFGVFLYFFFGGGIFSVRLPNYYLIFLIFLVPRMLLALRGNLGYKNIVFFMFFMYSIILYVHFYNNWGHKSGFGYYTTSLNKFVPYHFFEKSEHKKASDYE